MYLLVVFGSNRISFTLLFYEISLSAQGVFAQIRN